MFWLLSTSSSANKQLISGKHKWAEELSSAFRLLMAGGVTAEETVATSLLAGYLCKLSALGRCQTSLWQNVIKKYKIQTHYWTIITIVLLLIKLCFSVQRTPKKVPVWPCVRHPCYSVLPNKEPGAPGPLYASATLLPDLSLDFPSPLLCTVV